jgi:FKBP-type peptidyl-prolyl cis-trans isomerase FkpA
MTKKFYRSILFLIAAGIFISLGSCNPASKYEKAEQDAINNYLNANSTMAYELKPSGLYYLDVVVGTGRTPVMHDTAYVIYTGKFLDGTVFDTNVGKANLIFPVAEGLMIPGFDEGITYMKAGGKASLLVPSKLAYGSQGYYTIGGYTPLLYEVELVQVKAGPGK